MREQRQTLLLNLKAHDVALSVLNNKNATSKNDSAMKLARISVHRFLTELVSGNKAIQEVMVRHVEVFIEQVNIRGVVECSGHRAWLLRGQTLSLGAHRMGTGSLPRPAPDLPLTYP